MHWVGEPLIKIRHPKSRPERLTVEQLHVTQQLVAQDIGNYYRPVGRHGNIEQAPYFPAQLLVIQIDQLLRYRPAVRVVILGVPKRISRL
jgi:hypothetical protein